MHGHLFNEETIKMMAENGARADLLIYRSNPLRDIEVAVDHAGHLVLVMKGNKVYKNMLD